MSGKLYRFIKYSCILIFVFACCTAFSQQANRPVIFDQMQSYFTKAVQEKLFLHTDKDFYLAGEILWFKIYYTDGSFHRPMNLSSIAYTEILNEKNESILQAAISLQPGKGSGSFYLPVTLSAGNYTLRAYTRWMRNFDEAYFFEKKITIVNTLKNPESVNPGDTIPVAVNFFPEGGNLVAGIQSRVGFMVTDGQGGINDCRGFILDKNNDTVISFSPIRFGIGNFDFIPEPGNDYRAIVILPGNKIIRKTLPEIFSSGYVMRVMENKTGQILVLVKRKRASGQQIPEPVLLISHTRQIPGVAEIKSMNEEDSAVFIIDKAKVSKGITHFTLFDGKNQPVCERLFFNKPSPAATLQIDTDKSEYGNRERISLSLGIKNISTDSSVFNLSASVFPRDSLHYSDQASIFSYMWLSSDLPGYVESPEYYFSDAPDATVAVDNLMLTYGWRRFRWNDILENKTDFVKYLPEINGHLISGIVHDIRNKPAQGINTFLTVAGRPFGFYTARSNESGEVLYEVKNFYGNSQLIAQPGWDADSTYKVEIIKPYAQTTALRKYTHYRLTEKSKEMLLQRSIGMQVQNIYYGDSLRRFLNPVISDTLPFYGQAQRSYRLDNYKRFTTMEEVLREYVAEIGVNLRRGKLHLRIFDFTIRDFYDNYTLVLLDGVPLTDRDKIFSYDPLKVRRLDIFHSPYINGHLVFYGIASFITYSGVFDGYELDPKLIAIDYNGLQLQREFFSPVYKTKEQSESRLPDLRNTLYWNPDIITNKDGKTVLQFYSSDKKGEYHVVVHGMNDRGDIVTGKATFEVK